MKKTNDLHEQVLAAHQLPDPYRGLYCTNKRKRREKKRKKVIMVSTDERARDPAVLQYTHREINEQVNK